MVDQYKQQLDSMMQREISRGEFLKLIGIALLGIIGVVGFIKNLHELIPDHSTTAKLPPTHHQVAKIGYGRSPYGR